MKMLKKITCTLKNKKGMTMSSVLVAFAMLSLILLMFWQAVTISSNLFRKSEDIRRETEALYSGFYEDTAYKQKNSGTGEKTTIKFTEADGSEAFSVDSHLGKYTNAESGGRAVYYFGYRSGEVGP